MKKIGFFKKIVLYFSYRRALLQNKEVLLSTYNLRVDRVKRIYTVLNIPTDIFDDPYNMRTSDINKISEPYIKEFLRQVSEKLNSIGLGELYDTYDIKKIDKFSFLIIIGFRLFNTDKVANLILFRLIPIACLITLIIFILENYY
jgi:hypothetical protein